MAEPSLRYAADAFALEFVRWGLEIPAGDIGARRDGQIRDAGWSVLYRFDRDDRGEYLEYYAARRSNEEKAANDRHVRIYDSGERETLPPVLDAFLYSRDPTPDELAAARKQHESLRQNQAPRSNQPSQAASLLLDDETLTELEGNEAPTAARSAQPATSRSAPAAGKNAPRAAKAQSTGPAGSEQGTKREASAKAAVAADPSASSSTATESAATAPRSPKEGDGAKTSAAKEPEKQSAVKESAQEPAAKVPAKDAVSAKAPPKSAPASPMPGAGQPSGLELYYPDRDHDRSRRVEPEKRPPAQAAIPLGWESRTETPKPVRRPRPELALDEDDMSDLADSDRDAFEFNPMRRRAVIAAVGALVVLGAAVSLHLVGRNSDSLNSPTSALEQSGRSAGQGKGSDPRAMMVPRSELSLSGAPEGTSSPIATPQRMPGVDPVAVPIRPGELTPIRLSEHAPSEEPTVFRRHTRVSAESDGRRRP